MTYRALARRGACLGPALIVLALAALGCRSVAPMRSASDQTPAPPADSIAQGGAIVGSAAPAATVTIYEDFQCTYCKKNHATVRELARQYADKVGFAFKPYVGAVLRQGYDAHRHASHRAACAALAAAMQGKLLEMADILFENQYRFGDEDLRRYAREIGLDIERFDRDRQAPETLARVDAFKEEARRLRIATTPTFFVGDRRLEGRQSRDELARAIEEALGRGPAQLVARPISAESLGPRFEDMIYHRPAPLPARSDTTPLEPGERAPDFSLMSVEGKRVSLKDYRGRNHVLLSFVPAAFTPVCSGQWPQYAAYRPEFEKRDVAVVGITTDNTPSQYAWLQGMREIDFPVLSDYWPHGKVARAYGVLRPDAGVAERAVFLIDKQGAIRFVRVYDIDESPPIDEVMQAIEQLR